MKIAELLPLKIYTFSLIIVNCCSIIIYIFSTGMFHDQVKSIPSRVSDTLKYGVGNILPNTISQQVSLSVDSEIVQNFIVF